MLGRWLVIILVLLGAGFAAMRWAYVETAAFPDRSSAPLLPSTELEKVATLDLPPGNIAVSDSGRIFFTFHPEAGPEINVAELRDGKPVPFPNAAWQPGGAAEKALKEVLSLRLYKDELWLLDNGRHGLSTVRLLGFDTRTGELIHEYKFPRDVFPLGSHANDFQISPDGRYFYITDASLIARTPALVVFDRPADKSWRLLQGSASVAAGAFEPVVQGRGMTILGAFTVNPGVDGIALDQQGEWLYFAGVSADQLYRVRTADLHDHSMPFATLDSRVQALGEKTMTDGMAVDADNNVYLTDLEHSAVVRRTPQGELQTLLRSAELRWPDGFSLAADGYLYLTCSSLHQVIGVPREEMMSKAPFHIYRFSLERANQILSGSL